MLLPELYCIQTNHFQCEANFFSIADTRILHFPLLLLTSPKNNGLRDFVLDLYRFQIETMARGRICWKIYTGDRLKKTR